MSIRPIDLNGMIQKTQDISTLKQNEDNKPAVEQQMLYSQEVKKTEQKMRQVVEAHEKENQEFRYDAREKGNGQQYKSSGKKKKRQQKNGSVIKKGQDSGFDIKI